MSDGKKHKPKQDRGKKLKNYLKNLNIDEYVLDNIQIAYSSW